MYVASSKQELESGREASRQQICFHKCRAISRQVWCVTPAISKQVAGVECSKLEMATAMKGDSDGVQ